MRNGKNGMVSFNDYVAGWLDGSIHDFLNDFPRSFTKIDCALITSLDSHPAPSSLLATSPTLQPLAPDAKPLGAGILVPTARLLTIPERIFFGFDEVWFFPDDRIEPKPDSAWLVGPHRIDQQRIDAIGSWMRSNHCSLALGDGDGLNFIVKARGLARYLIAYSMLQAQPETGGEEEATSPIPTGLERPA